MLRNAAGWLLLLLGSAASSNAGAAFCWDGGAVPSGCGAALCRWHLVTHAHSAEGVLRGGTRLRLAPRSAACCTPTRIVLERGACDVRAQQCLHIAAAGAGVVALRGSARIQTASGLAHCMVSEGTARINDRVVGPGTAWESGNDERWRLIPWPRSLAQEGVDVFAWPQAVTARRGCAPAPYRAADERWLLARMLARALALPPLQRTAVLQLVLERGTPGLQCAVLGLLSAEEQSWLSATLAVLRRGGHRVVQQRLSDAISARPSANMPCDLSLRDPLLRQLEALRRGRLEEAEAAACQLIRGGSMNCTLDAVHSRAALRTVLAHAGPDWMPLFGGARGMLAASAQCAPAVAVEFGALIDCWIAPGSDCFGF